MLTVLLLESRLSKAIVPPTVPVNWIVTLLSAPRDWLNFGKDSVDVQFVGAAGTEAAYLMVMASAEAHRMSASPANTTTETDFITTSWIQHMLVDNAACRMGGGDLLSFAREKL